MNIYDWIKENCASLKGKRVAVSGSTGGLGKELCNYLAHLGADLILMDRNENKVSALEKELLSTFGEVNINKIKLDLSDMGLVKSAVSELKVLSPDIIILNAGAYSIPRHKCDTGLDNVFQINFASPYYIVKKLLPILRENGGKVVAVGSIAHNYSRLDLTDLDFSSRNKASLVYGNTKRFLMFSLFELFKNEKSASLSVVHPGITFTGITAHYPKIIFALIKRPMKIIFMKPKKAALSILKGVFDNTYYHHWIGPEFFNIWGKPKKQKLKTCSKKESNEIFSKAENIYKSIKGD
ncbi:MAG: SDR family NAD(P)-dependent oxidoreductase [Ruminococcaceae bacterium]|nr:SDR family NAD(P)-dependent oxidoreductase [Oscillospiraceae bacterium]